MGLITLTPGQIVTIHGLFPASRLLTWEQVCGRKLSPSYLHRWAKISREHFKELQPDPAAWVAEGLVTLEDCDALSELPLNPLRHLKLPVDALFGCSFHQLQKYGITFDEMVEAGLSPGTMALFHFSLQEWKSLGMSDEHIHRMTEAQCVRLFGMGVQEACRADA